MARRIPGKTSGALRTSLVVAHAALLAACADQIATAPRQAAPASSLGGTGVARYVVALQEGTTGADLAAAVGGQLLDEMPAIGAAVIAGASPDALMAAGARGLEPDYEFTLEPTQGEPVPASALPGSVDPANAAGTANAPWFTTGVQWNMKVIRAADTWSGSAAGAGARVCIIDSGIDEAHQELAGKVVASRSFVPQGNSTTEFSPAPLDSNGHGSHVASTVTTNGVVLASVAPAAQLMAAKVFAATGGTSVARVVNAITWCADNGAHAINMSLNGRWIYPTGTPLTTIPEFNAYVTAVQYAHERGVVLVNSGGNQNTQQPNPAQIPLPAGTPGILTVGATGPVTKVIGTLTNGTVVSTPIASPPAWDPMDPAQVWQNADGRAFYSNFGTGITLFAPGGRGAVSLSYVRRIALVPPGNARVTQGIPLDNIYGVCSSVTSQTGQGNVGGAPGAGASCLGQGDRYIAYNGTSMAAPHVVGAAAVLYSELGAQRSPENRARVEACLRASADNIGPSSIFGGGRLNVSRAVEALRAGAC
jgi:subtilisin family serine protease